MINNTGLSGGFDYDLRWAPERTAPDATAAQETAPSICTALEEQLGLKLVPGTGPVQVLVIDSISPPTSN